MKYLVYTPKFDGNREKDKANQFTIQISPLSFEDFTAYKAMSRTWKDENQLGGIATNDEEITRERVKKHCGEIKGLYNLFGEEIKTVDELLGTPAFWALIFEIESALIDISILRAGMEKN